MADYIGLKCPICNETFKFGDDIVVCPYCGAPYHRECFQKEGKCIFEDKHEQGFKWQPPAPKVEDVKSSSEGTETTATPDSDDANRTKICPRCSHRNAKDALFCDNCGYSFANNNSGPYSGYSNQNPQQNQVPFGGMGGSTPLMFDPLGGVNPNEDFDGVTAGELAKYIKGSTPYYLNEFKKIKEKRPSRFNFSAFLFSGGWLLYRKQYKWGTVLTVILAVVMLITTFIDIFFNQAILTQAAANTGVTGSLFNSQNLQYISSEISLLPWYLQLLFYSPIFLYIIQFAMMITVGIRGNRMYMKHCIKMVKKLKGKRLSTDEYEKQLNNKGGVNTPLAMILLLCYVIISYIPVFI